MIYKIVFPNTRSVYMSLGDDLQLVIVHHWANIANGEILRFSATLRLDIMESEASSNTALIHFSHFCN